MEAKGQQLWETLLAAASLRSDDNTQPQIKPRPHEADELMEIVVLLYVSFSLSIFFACLYLVCLIVFIFLLLT